MTFQNRHHQAVSDVIRDTMENMDQPVLNPGFLAGKAKGIEEVANSLADMFAHDSFAFDREVFMAACSLE